MGQCVQILLSAANCYLKKGITAEFQSHQVITVAGPGYFADSDFNPFNTEDMNVTVLMLSLYETTVADSSLVVTVQRDCDVLVT